MKERARRVSRVNEIKPVNRIGFWVFWIGLSISGHCIWAAPEDLGPASSGVPEARSRLKAAPSKQVAHNQPYEKATVAPPLVLPDPLASELHIEPYYPVPDTGKVVGLIGFEPVPWSLEERIR